MRFFAILFLCLSMGMSAAWGISIDPGMITIIAGSNAYSGIPLGSGSTSNATQYVHANALDRDAGPNARYLSDYASSGAGNATFLDFQFSNPIIFDQIVFTDRTSSGGANFSNSRGIADWVTSYQFIFSNDASFSSPVATVQVLNRTAPTAGNPNLSAWQTTSAFGPITARYVRWDVISARGVNPGMADIDFFGTVVPEPGTYALMGTVAAALFMMSRRRRSRAAN